ncbi:MAG: ABC transporter permease subunit [Thermoplasmata archaeon]|nr:ABC transporter permease subunit [Thermoplasmata archaeon]
MVSRKRLHEQFKGYYKAFKTNWDLFKASRIGLVGLGILVFFIVVALITPALGLRDPINWRAPEEDLIEVARYWYVNTSTVLFDAGDPINQSVAFRLEPASLEPLTDRVYFASGEKVIALRPSTGRMAWYVGNTNNKVCCVEADSVVTAGPVISNYGAVDQPTTAHWILYFGTESGEFYQLREPGWTELDPVDRSSQIPIGKDRSQTTLDSKITSIAVYADGNGGVSANERVFVGTEGGSLYAFSAIWKDDETWFYNASSNEWARAFPKTRPLPQDRHIMAHSPVSGKVLLVSGDNGIGTGPVQTWLYDLAGENWTKLDGLTEAPVRRRESAMVYVPSSDSAILYGGRSGNEDLDDLWAFNFSSENWTQLDVTGPGPGLRSGHSMAYGANEHAIYLFGGRQNTGLNKTMRLDIGNNWSVVATDESVLTKGTSMIYDALGNRLVVFGGEEYRGPGDNNQTKVLNITFGEWSWIDTPVNLTARAWQSIAYDNATNSAILIGGMDNQGERFGDVWKLDFADNDSWTQLDSTGSPSSRFGSSMVFLEDSEAFLFGGDDYQPSELWKISDPKFRPVLMAGLPLQMKHSPRASPAIYLGEGSSDGAYLVFNGGGYLAHVYTENGTSVWRDSNLSYISGADGTIGVGSEWSTAPIFSQLEGTIPPMIYFSTSNGFLHALHTGDGRAYDSWAIAASGEEFPDGQENPDNGIYGIPMRKTLAELDQGVLTRPELHGSSIYVGSNSGTFYSIRRDRTGELRAGTVLGKYVAPVAPGERFIFNTPANYLLGSQVILISGYNDGGTPDDWTDDVSTIFSLNTDGTVSWMQTLDARVNGPLTIWKDEQGSGHLHRSVFAGLTDGTIQVHSSNGRYLAPLAPTWMEPVPSGNTYWLGTDNQGRDLYSQWMWGTRVALTVGLLAAFFSISIGVIIGLVSGYSGGKTDSVLMRFTDVILVLPGLPLVIILAAVLGAGIWNIILVISIVGWPGTARVIRSEVLSLKERPFIDSARVTGASNIRIMFKHIAPNVLPLAFLYMTFAVSGAILTEAALSFIGLGDVNTASWGQMLQLIQQSNVLGSWWWLMPPGLGITFLSLAFYLIGRGYEQIVNPRLRVR